MTIAWYTLSYLCQKYRYRYEIFTEGSPYMYTGTSVEIAPEGKHFLSIVIYGCVWLCIVVYSCVWLCMVVYGFEHVFFLWKKKKTSIQKQKECITHFELVVCIFSKPETEQIFKNKLPFMAINVDVWLCMV
jgi:hypothetical protein